MEDVTPKERMLKKIRQALIHKSENRFPSLDLDSNVYAKDSRDIAVVFADHFSTLSGEFLFCENKFEFIDQLITLIEQKGWQEIFCWEKPLQQEFKDLSLDFREGQDQYEQVEVGITSCEALVARTGSLVVSSRKNSRTLTVYPPVHVVVAYTSQLVMELKDAFVMLQNKYGTAYPSMVSVISGPSRTADIEKTLVMGAHGPKELYVFLIDDTSNT